MVHSSLRQLPQNTHTAACVPSLFSFPTKGVIYATNLETYPLEDWHSPISWHTLHVFLIID